MQREVYECLSLGDVRSSHLEIFFFQKLTIVKGDTISSEVENAVHLKHLTINVPIVSRQLIQFN